MRPRAQSTERAEARSVGDPVTGVHLVGWSGTSRPGGGIEARAYVDDVRVIVRRSPVDRSVTWRCAQHGESTNTPELCGHTQTLAETPAHAERNNR